MPTSNSYTGPLPAVRPPPKTPLPVAPESRSAEIRVSEQRAPEIWLDATEDTAEEALAAAAMTPAVPSAVILPARLPESAPMFAVPAPLFAAPAPRFEMPAAMPAPSFSRPPSSDRAFLAAQGAEPGARPSVPPVVATLPPLGLVIPAKASWVARRRFSADSKLLAGGGARAAALPVLALGALLGQRTAKPAPTTAAATGSYPLVVETKAVAAAMPLPAAALPAATPVAAAQPVAAKVDVPLTIDVQQLPTARPQVRWAPEARAVPQAGAAAGWTVAARPAQAAPAQHAADPEQAAASSDGTETVARRGARRFRRARRPRSIRSFRPFAKTFAKTSRTASRKAPPFQSARNSPLPRKVARNPRFGRESR